MQSFNHAEFKRKVKKGRNKSKQSKAWNTSRWPSNGKQVGLVAKWQGLGWGSIGLAAVLQEKHFSSLVWATLFPHSAVVLTLAGQDRRQAWPNEKQTPFTPVLPISPCGFFVFKEKRTLSKNRFGARVPMGFETFFSTPSSHASSLARPWRESRGKNRTRKRQDDQRGEKVSPECLEKGLW